MAPKEQVITPENFTKAFEFVLQQLGTFSLTKQEHILVEQIIKQGRSIAIPPPQVAQESADPKEALASEVKKSLTEKK